jgi:hypothetical protein
MEYNGTTGTAVPTTSTHLLLVNTASFTSSSDLK